MLTSRHGRLRRVPKHFRVIEKLPLDCNVVSPPPPLQHQIYASQKKKEPFGNVSQVAVILEPSILERGTTY